MNRISRVSISNDGRDLPLPMPLQKPGKVLPPKQWRRAAESTKGPPRLSSDCFVSFHPHRRLTLHEEGPGDLRRMRSSASPRPTLHLAIFLVVTLASASAFPHSNLPLGSPSRQGGNISPRMSAIKAPPKAIIFDIDGTLADSYNLAFTATNTVLRNNGHQETTPDEYHQGTR